MKANRRKSTRLHAAIRTKRTTIPFKLRAFLIALCLIAIGLGLYFLYAWVVGVCREQSIITDLNNQVEVTTGEHIRRDLLIDCFGLKEGMSLFDLDLSRKREETMRRLPNLRRLDVSRKFPNRLSIVAEERLPIARMNVEGERRISGRVVDAEGIVFNRRKNTDTLPTIREEATKITPAGQRLTGRTFAALTFLLAADSTEYPEIVPLEVNTSSHDCLIVTLSDYSRLKIRWDDWLERQSKLDSLKLRLKHLSSAMRSTLATGTRIWNATEADRIYADTKDPIR